MYEERCRGFNLLGFVVYGNIKFLLRLNIFISHTILPFGEIFINLLGKAIFKLSARSPAPQIAFAPTMRAGRDRAE